MLELKGERSTGILASSEQLDKDDLKRPTESGELKDLNEWSNPDFDGVQHSLKFNNHCSCAKSKIQSLTQQLEEAKVTEVAIKNLKSQLQQKERQMSITGKTVKSLRESNIELAKENEKLKYMIDNCLGWEDMKNDITYPSEI